MRSGLAIVAIGLNIVGGGSVHAAPVQPRERAEIVKLRAANNQAIAAHDLSGTMAIAGDDYIVVAGESAIKRSAADVRAVWQTSFATPGFDRYVRTPASISIGDRAGVLRAAESGTWYGLTQKPAGLSRPYGRYFAHWLKRDGRWQIVGEIYVALGCSGKGC